MTKHRTVFLTATLAALLAPFSPVPIARADIFQWEYINPANPSQGKQQSTTLAPGGAGVNAVPAANLSYRNLTMAYLIGADLRNSTVNGANLTNADLSQTNLTNANFWYDGEFESPPADLTSATLSNAIVLGTQFTSTNLTMSQLASTASYQARNLTGIGLAGVNLAAANFASQNLTYATFSGATLTGANFNHINAPDIVLAHVNLANASFDHANLANSYFDGAILHNADFSGAFLAGTHMGHTSLAGVNLSAAIVCNADLRATGITAAQLYSTASYQAHDLRGVKLSANFTGGDFAGQDFAGASLNGVTLANADLRHANLVNGDLAGFLYYDDQGGIFVYPGANLAGANLTGVDSRGANLQYATLTGATMHNMIQPNGRIAGLDLTAGKFLVIRDYDGNPFVFPSTGLVPVDVQQHLVADATSTLHFVFGSDAWNSTISFARGIPVTLGGTLELAFAPGVDVATQSGRTIDLFDWTGVTPTGAFTVSSRYTWDLSKLYTTGEVTLAPNLPGDFNNDGTVDAADYVVWRKTGINGPTGYDTWRTHFGEPGGSGSVASANATVPEPKTLVMLIVAAVGIGMRRRGIV